MEMTMIKYNEIERDIQKQLEALVNDLFYKYQTELDIEDGDIGIDNEFALSEKIEELTTVIMGSLENQLETKADEEAETGED